MKNNNYDTEEIMTDRLILMKGTEKDFLKVYEYDFRRLSNVDDIFEFKKATNSEIKKWFSKGKKNYYNTVKKAHMFDWIIYLDNMPIGNIVTLDENIKSSSIGISFNLHPSFWGKGYMPEALEAVLNYLFKIGYDIVRCEYLDGNLKAKRVTEKLGFKAFNIKKDSFKGLNGNNIDIYDLIIEKDDWLSRTSKIKL